MKMFDKFHFILFSLSALFLLACSDVSFSTKGGVSALGCAPGENCLEPLPTPSQNIQLVTRDITVKETIKAVDILFVVDNSGSMAPQLQKLADKFPNFISSLADLDWQICVTTTDIGATDGHLLEFPNGSTVIKKTDLLQPGFNAQEEFEELMNSLKEAKGSGDERGIFAINRALRHNEGCFRREAALSTVVISDEDERSVGGFDKTDPWYKVLERDDYAKSVLDRLASLNMAEKPYTAHSIIIRPATPDLGFLKNDEACYDIQQKDSQYKGHYGVHYAELTRLTRGILGDICAADYGEQLAFIGKNIQNSLSAVNLECEPVDEKGLKITSARAVIQKLSPDPNPKIILSGNKLQFEPALQSGTQLSLRYYCVK